MANLSRLEAEATREFYRRRTLPDVLTACFDKQVAFINDPAKRKALFVARRSGKTWAIAVSLIQTALSAPVTKCLYYGFTRTSAWETIYLHMLEPLCARFGIPVTVNLSSQTITFANRSYIRIMGDDASDRQIDKALGSKYKLVVFDECQGITHDLEAWCKQKLGPAMVDLGGTIVLAGTAGMYMGERFWYRVTKTDGVREPGWSVHSWTPFDNPHMAALIAQQMQELKSENASVELEPWFQQEWLCRWVVETSARIYKYDPAKNGRQTHDFSSKLWRYVIGMDFGFEDDTALVVGAFHPHDPNCYIVDSFKKPRMLEQEVAETILEWKARYNPMMIVGDCQNKTLIETIRAVYKIPIRAADKLGKVAHIAAMNSDFRMGKIMVLEPANRALIKEWDELVWDERKRLLGEFKENPSKDNHLADAALYLHHASKHYLAQPAPEPDLHPMRSQAEAELRAQLSQHQAGFELYEQLEKIA